jgi:hypothetical protein
MVDRFVDPKLWVDYAPAMVDDNWTEAELAALKEHEKGLLGISADDDPGDADPGGVTNVPIPTDYMDWSKVKWVTNAGVEASPAATASLRERAGLSCPTDIGDEDVEGIGRVGRF